MSTNPLGKGTSNVTVNMSDSLKSDLKRLAKASGLTMGSYLKTVLRDYVDSRAVIKPASVFRGGKAAPAASAPAPASAGKGGKKAKKAKKK